LSNILVTNLVLSNYFPPHTGSVQSFTAPQEGTYKLEVWGAQGAGWYGKGGYAHGNINLKSTIYICIGSCGGLRTHSYNGGGSGDCSGGGATHISITNRGELKNYQFYQSEVLIVAGGGGGGERFQGGFGGGTNGDNSGNVVLDGTSYIIDKVSEGGSQTSGGTAGIFNSWAGQKGSFGMGGDGINSATVDQGAGGGGGWYGGGGIPFVGAAGGGSGHLGSILINGSMQSGVRDGDGYAIITQISF